MRYHALATDYDGTIAHDGRVDSATLDALRKLAATGRKLILVTGRELPELMQTFPEFDVFHWIVAENGALLYQPATETDKLLVDAPPATFVEALRRKAVAPMSVGRGIVATWEPHEKTVLETIRDLGLEFQVIFNKGAVMILPAGVNKATGLTAALKEMRLSAHNVVGVGDAENDHAFLRLCQFSAAVSNALPAVKETADMVTQADHGAGVTQLIERIIENDLADFDSRLTRHWPSLGAADGQPMTVPAFGQRILIAGPADECQSTTAAILDTLREHAYQFCVIDPDGEFGAMGNAIAVGSAKSVPQTSEVLAVLDNPEANAAVSLAGIPPSERSPFVVALLPLLLQMGNKVGRPHWLVIGKAHSLLSAGELPAGDWPNLVLLADRPNQLSRGCLGRVNTILAVGSDAGNTLHVFAGATRVSLPAFDLAPLEPGEILFWNLDDVRTPRRIKRKATAPDRQRLARKYVAGELTPECSFFFQGPDRKLNLRAQNLVLFLQIADGIDDETWEFHRRNNDYSTWFRQQLKDEELAIAARQVEDRSAVAPSESKALLRAAVERLYPIAAS